MKKERKRTSLKPPVKKKKYFNPYDDTPSETNGLHIVRNTSKTANTRKSRVKRKPGEAAAGKVRSSAPRSRQSGGSSASHPVTQERRRRLKQSEPGRKPAAVNERRTVKSPSGSPDHKPHVAKKHPLTARQKMRLKKRRQRLQMLRTCMLMLITIGGVVGIFHLKESMTKTKISIQQVQTGNLDTSATLEGVIFRDERVVKSQESGSAQYTVAEGEKIKKGGSVYVLADEKNVNATTERIEDVEQQIYKNAENNKYTATNLDQRYNLDKEVQGNFSNYYNNCFNSSTNFVYTLRSKLDSNVASRTSLYVQQQKEADDGLAQEKQQLDKALGQYQVGKTASDSGIISFHMDNHETEDAMSAIQKLTYDEFSKLRKVTTSTQLGQSTLEKDAPIYKLVLSNTWYIVCYVSAKEDNYLQDAAYQLHFEELGDTPVTFTLVEKKEAEDKIRLVFKTSDQIGSFLSTRAVTFSIGEKSATGLKIPTQAIVEQNYIKIPMNKTVTDNETTGCYRKKGQVTEFVSLTIMSKDEENQCYYVMQDLTDPKNIQIGDVLVDQKDGSTYEVKDSIVKQGVYVVNGKIASFKEIEIVSQSSEYAIVRYNSQSQLRELDRIISNPKSVKRDQLLEELNVQNK